VAHCGLDNGLWWGLVGGESCGRSVVQGMLEREMMAVRWSTKAALSGTVGRAVMSNGGEEVGDFQLGGRELEAVVCGRRLGPFYRADMGLRGVRVEIPMAGDGWASTFIAPVMGEEVALGRGGVEVRLGASSR
jgi:hypothetical protein